MNAQEAVTKRLVGLCNERGLAVNALARNAGIPPTTLKNIIYGNSKNPGISTIKMICDGLNITLEEFFLHDIFRNLEQEIE